MAGGGVHDPDFTLVDLNQATHFGGSGTLVSDEELVCTSGFLVELINNTIPSGLEDFLETVDPEVLAGVLNFSFQSLLLRGDDNDGTPQTVQGFASLRFSKNVSNFVEWSVRAPSVAASGINFEFGWTPSATNTGSVVWEFNLHTLSSGVDLAAVVPITSILTLAASPEGGSWIKDRMYINSIAVSGLIEALQIVNVELKFIGSDSSINQNDHLMNAAINFSV